MKRKKLLKIIALDMVLILSTSSVFAATFAWYIAQRQASLSLQTIQVEGAMDVKFKWFKWNESHGSQDITSTDAKLSGYKKPSASNNPITFGTYATDFYEQPKEQSALAFEMDEVFPNIRFTFSLEITSHFSNPTAIGLEMSNFIPGVSPESFRYDVAPNDTPETAIPISLAEALDIYVLTLDSIDNTAIGNFILQDQTNDKFNYQTGDTSAILNEGVTFNNNDTKYFLFTIEFSDNPTTYYKQVTSTQAQPSFKEVNGKMRYFYEKHESGSSNVYQNLLFDVGKLVIRRM